MVKRLAGLLLAISVLMFLFTGCGAKSSARDSASMGNAAYSQKDAGASPSNAGDYIASDTAVGAEQSKSTANGDSTAIFSSGNEGNETVNTILEQRKVIRSANVSIEVDSYEKTYGKIETLVEHSGLGYIQESSLSTKDEYVDGKTVLIKSGIVVVRIQADKFTQILNDVKGLGELLDANVKSDDVTDKYYDIESELRLLKYEQNRLEQYLNKVTDPDTIFKTESRLTEIRHQIESLTGNLNKMDNLVKLSTITINISEKVPEQQVVVVKEKEKTYLEKLFGNFSGSTKGVVSFFGSFLLFLANALPVLVVLALLAWAGFAVYKKIRKRQNRGAENITKGNDINNSL